MKQRLLQQLVPPGVEGRVLTFYVCLSLLLGGLTMPVFKNYNRGVETERQSARLRCARCRKAPAPPRPTTITFKPRGGLLAFN
ncbi:hypothetical protein EVAR_44931_1 [Eumeta japonica]|uniref:Uncharacterized protein n=1 Tax=Eumeta variegata TaxID=151549 RepID=A0A4C2AB10_EUMVA|nr:hypothetical protein EVAR_44931_1 [Eumeta japonica]